ncbi:putative mitochondrial-processing peptidase subunit alpha protein [Daldinia childiae]|uniref:putative mitochondrial-processing peptidase subunit alpha protein n=1 Tax=Daldinia childiae TaxID=326645 RepID=UPI00144744B1|nr:putative mitochondrial-processing peptidase subunit alpha protein [Daldinia childiae]KAF3060363.1 putative mitochondrial-processing peptidase subunit alpha protein [Daldinia childiae]
MKQREEDVESQAQLLSKESQSPSSEEFDYDEPENSHQNQSSRRRRRIEQNPLWRRIQSFTLPIWAPCRKFSPKYYVFAIVVSLLITLFIFNPYSPTIPTQHQTDVDVSPGTPTSTIASSTKAAKPTESSTPAYKPPKLEANDKYCTTWPVGEDGRYEPKGASRANKIKIDSIAPKGGWKKPAGIKVIANLASNGGYFDEVWFMAHTKEKDDVSWIEDLVQKTPGYKIVYIHPDAIPQLVHTRIALPHPYAISSNLVNSPVTGMEQYHYGAIHPFLPDPSSKPSFHAAETWRASEKKKYPKDQLVDEYKIMDMEPSYRGHPWLLISDDHYDLLKTPMGKYDQNRGSDPIAFGLAWKSWAIGAQQQYSLLYNLEQNKMQRYFFGRNIRYPESALGPNASAVVFPNGDGPGGEQTYDTGYNRYNLNFCAVWGSDIRDQLPIADDDEQDITADIPRRIGRPFVIDTPP